ncbi:cupin domain-containing protein [Pseudorhodoplanes sp.]|uniref:cupin domain-containing protein n=1 Tax=Pseudorhodoplanes sp. TaxID=1934341 RepID=UPI00391CBCDF
MIRLAVAVAACALLTASSFAQRAPDAPAQAKAAPNAAGYPALPLLSTSTTVVGEKLRYPDGEPHVTAAIVTLLPGQRTIPHTHGVPLFAYILDGELSVDYGAHGIRTYKKGDSLMEAMDVVHFGFNPGKEPVRLLAVYMGAKGAKDVVPVK